MGCIKLNVYLARDHRVQELFQSNLPASRNILLAFQKEHLQRGSHFHNCLLREHWLQAKEIKTLLKGVISLRFSPPSH